MKQIKQMAAIAGLAALVSGCYSTNAKVIETCEQKDMTVKVVQYYYRGGNYISLEFYSKYSDPMEGELVGIITSFDFNVDATQLRCKDGKTLRFNSSNWPYFVEDKK